MASITGPRPRRAGMKVGAWACAALLAGIAGCGGIKPRRSPKGTFDSIRKAIVEEDYEALWGLLSAGARQKESARISAEQRRVEAEFPNYSEKQRERFRTQNGISAEEYVNLSPAGVFAMEQRYDRRLSRSLRTLLDGAKVKDVSLKGDRATVEVAILGETEPAKLALEKQSGLWRVPGMDGLVEAFDIAGRARRAGEIPADTYRAALACIADQVYGDLWDLFSADGKVWLAGIIKEDQETIASYDEQDARKFERASGMRTADFAGLPPKEAFVVGLKANVAWLVQIVRLLSLDFVSADIVGDKAEIRLRGLREPLPLERENGRWYFARLK